MEIVRNVPVYFWLPWQTIGSPHSRIFERALSEMTTESFFICGNSMAD